MRPKPKRKLRIMVLVHEDLVPPDSVEGLTQEQIQPWKTEYHVVTTLRSLGHEVFPVGVYSDLTVIRKAIEDQKPHISFNLLEEFHGYSLFDQHVVSYLELLRMPYTGCNPRGLTLSHDKALSKKILAYHRIAVPDFAVFPLNRKARGPQHLKFPLLVKSLIEEGSAGISRASVVYDDEKLAERVDFIHRQTNTPAIVEQYIEGREIYVGVIGNQRLQAYTPWELRADNLPDGAPLVATGRLKWNRAYQAKIGVVTEAAKLPPELRERFQRVSKRIYRTLYLSGYARLDYRLTEDDRIFLLEANPNPDIAWDEDFADSAKHAGVKYDRLLQKILTLGLGYETIG